MAAAFDERQVVVGEVQVQVGRTKGFARHNGACTDFLTPMHRDRSVK